MSGIYIPGMVMPTEGALIAIRPDGKAYFIAANPKDACETEVIPVPDHGRLIDADAVFKRLRKQAMSVWGNGDPRYQIVLEVMDAIRFAPTIIPEDKEGEE